MSDEVVFVLGVGPGLGAAVARRFAREGFAVGLLARSADSIVPVEKELAESGARVARALADATNAASVREGLAAVTKELGPPDVFVYNAGAFKMGGVLDVSPDEFDACWRANCAGAFYAAREVLPLMLAKKRGTILLTGATASLRGSARFSCLAVGKFGLRALGQSLAREFGPQGIHVAHVVVDGQIDLPRTRKMMPDRGADTFLSPDAIADTYFHLHAQHPSAWTLEVDVRPSTEKF
jgi:NAD(P)-dependent dehydrogenase (short-subunit alcohol dehydrogenase family)